jgi:uncharacterized membrane protein
MASTYLIPLLVLLVVVDGPLFLLAIFLKNRLPGEINSLYGYRTVRSMKNRATWVEANQYSSKLFYVSCLCLVAVQVPVATIWDGLTAIDVTLGLIIVQVLTIFIFTERHLRKTFGE